MKRHSTFIASRLTLSPGASADAVQLAGIEPMAASVTDPSPTPLFCDVVAAQGENPPAETARQVFDDRLETKWLDQARGQYKHSSWIQWQYVDPAGLVVTNVEEFLSLRAGAAESWPIRITGVIVGPAASPGGLCVMDGTGFLDAVRAPSGSNFLPGQRIVLEENQPMGPLTGRQSWPNRGSNRLVPPRRQSREESSSKPQWQRRTNGSGWRSKGSSSS